MLVLECSSSFQVAFTCATQVLAGCLINCVLLPASCLYTCTFSACIKLWLVPSSATLACTNMIVLCGTICQCGCLQLSSLPFLHLFPRILADTVKSPPELCEGNGRTGGRLVQGFRSNHQCLWSVSALAYVCGLCVALLLSQLSGHSAEICDVSVLATAPGLHVVARHTTTHMGFCSRLRLASLRLCLCFCSSSAHTQCNT
jgi:hypothetical protein